MEYPQDRRRGWWLLLRDDAVGLCGHARRRGG